jgi:hypothetical protein
MRIMKALKNIFFAAALGLCTLATGIPAQAQQPRRLVQAAQAYDLPPGSVVIEERPLSPRRTPTASSSCGWLRFPSRP